MIGLESGVVRLVPYRDEWRQLFVEESRRLRDVIGDALLDIQHVGSTAIPGMMAKPIIDIGIAVEDFERARVCIAPIQCLGYEYRGEHGIARRHYFVKGDPRTYHTHMVELRSRAWENMVLFRDYLIRCPEVAQEYAKLKAELAHNFPGDRPAYQDGKASFIEQVLRRAEAEGWAERL